MNGVTYLPEHRSYVDAAKALGVGYATVRRWVSLGVLDGGTYASGARYVVWTSVVRLLRSRAIRAADAARARTTTVKE